MAMAMAMAGKQKNEFWSELSLRLRLRLKTQVLIKTKTKTKAQAQDQHTRAGVVGLGGLCMPHGRVACYMNLRALCVSKLPKCRLSLIFICLADLESRG